jgi:hypothetical protein
MLLLRHYPTLIVGDGPMTRALGLTLLVVAIIGVPRAAHADVIVFRANLDGPTEPTNSPGIGTAVVDFDTIANTMRVRVNFSGLLAGVTAAHIHSATPTPGTGTAGVATTLPTFPGFPSGVTSGSYDNTLDMTMASSYNPAFVTANGGTIPSAEAALLASLKAGTSYLNIHTSLNPGGEIRGFLLAVPEPSSLVLLGALGLVACAWHGAALLRVREQGHAA